MIPSCFTLQNIVPVFSSNNCLCGSNILVSDKCLNAVSLKNFNSNELTFSVVVAK